MLLKTKAKIILLFLLFSPSLFTAENKKTAKKEKTAEELALEKTKKEIQRIKAEEELKLLKFNQSLAEEKKKLQELELKSALEKKEKELAQKGFKDEIEKIEQELKTSQQKHLLATQKLKEEIEILSLKNKVLAEQHKKEAQAFAERQLEEKIKQEDLISKQVMAELETKTLEQKLKLMQQSENLQNKSDHPIHYPEEPFQNGVLTISDRRIDFNGVVVYGSANYISERIHFFNNKSKTDPIFIVIGRSPGGSVMEGYRILKAMESSEAPIHVLVKSFAASMAATMATLADHSYAYENAIILHHQMSGLSYGNVTEREKALEIMHEWARRLHAPVAEKMGISLQEFYKEMYKNDPSGDWSEFANKAKELRWVDHIVYQVKEENFNENPDSEIYITKKKMKQGNFFLWNGLDQEEEGKQQEQVRLPRLDAFDFYFLYNNKQYTW